MSDDPIPAEPPRPVHPAIVRRQRLRLSLDQAGDRCRLSISRPAALRGLSQAQLFGSAAAGVSERRDAESVARIQLRARGLARRIESRYPQTTHFPGGMPTHSATRSYSPAEHDSSCPDEAVGQTGQRGATFTPKRRPVRPSADRAGGVPVPEAWPARRRSAGRRRSVTAGWAGHPDLRGRNGRWGRCRRDT